MPRRAGDTACRHRARPQDRPRPGRQPLWGAARRAARRQGPRRNWYRVRSRS